MAPPGSPVEESNGLTWRSSRPDFRMLPDATLEHFNSIAQQITHSANSIVFREGRPAEGVYVISEGLVKLFATGSRGRTIILKIAKLGDVLGLSPMMNGLPYDVTAQTLSPCHFTHITQHPFLSFLEEHAEAAYIAARIIAKEHGELVTGVRRMGLLQSAAGRIAHILIDFAKAENSTKLTHCFPMVLTHAELASLAGSSRETVTRLLNQFERDGIILRDDAMIKILKPIQLKKLVH